MPETHTARERGIVAAVAVGLILFRSIIFIFWEQSHFDSDEAITGLMAKHISAGRAFPVFWYGQNYMLAVEAWLAAAVFKVAGVSVATLKLPLLAINCAIALLLLRLLEREVGLRPALALVPTLFFVLPAPATAAMFLFANGGTVEPLLYVLLIWMTRRRPGWCGLIFGIGFLHREFTLYGFLALLAIEAGRGTLFTREGLRLRLATLRTAVGVWLFVQWIKHFSSGAGPGTSLADVYRPRDNVLELADRICVNVSSIPIGLWRLVTDHWPVIFGTRVQRLTDFGIESAGSQGLPGSGVLLAATAAIAVGAVAFRTGRGRWRTEYEFCAYLILAALFSALGYVVGRCGEISYLLMRYELLSITGLVGLGAWFLTIEPSRRLRQAWMAVAVACVAVALWAQLQLLKEYLTRTPVGGKQMLVRYLDAQGVRYAIDDYWIAYAVTFLTNERILVASSDFVRIQETQRLVNDHRDEAIRISRTPCEGGRQIIAGIYRCRP